MAPQLIYLALVFLGLGYSLSVHGQPRKPHDASGTLVSMAIVLPLLWWGGFFDPLLAR